MEWNSKSVTALKEHVAKFVAEKSMKPLKPKFKTRVFLDVLNDYSPGISIRMVQYWMKGQWGVSSKYAEKLDTLAMLTNFNLEEK